MMIDFEIDCSAFEKRAKELHAQIDQVPYALALAMNAAVKNTRQQAKGRLAIPPTGAVARSSSGVRKNQRPRAIVLNTPKRALRITDKGIFVGKGGRLHLMYMPSRPAPASPPTCPSRKTFAPRWPSSFAPRSPPRPVQGDVEPSPL